MANFDSLVIDRVLEIVGENSDGELLYLLNNLSNVSINTTSESKDKTDALGVLIKRFYTSKSVEVSADCNLLSFSMLSQTFGTDKNLRFLHQKSYILILQVLKSIQFLRS